jgi:hypothetical protein
VNWRLIFSNLLAGLPGGFLIIMAMLMINAVLSRLIPIAGWLTLLNLFFCSLVVGMLARLMRPYHGVGTALVAGVVAVLILLFLGGSPMSSTDSSPVLGIPAMLGTVAFSLLGAWLLPHLRRRNP